MAASGELHEVVVIGAGQGGLITNPPDRLPSFHAGKEAGVMASREPTEFGWYVLRKMAEFDPPLSQAALHRRAGVSESTVSRWIYQEIKPGDDKLGQLAEALGVDHGELLAKAGYGRPANHVAERPIHRLARDLDAILSPNSPIPAEDRAALETVLDRMIDPYRKLLRRRRPA